LVRPHGDARLPGGAAKTAARETALKETTAKNCA
jgi:hypothetical protein